MKCQACIFLLTFSLHWMKHLQGETESDTSSCSMDSSNFSKLDRIRRQQKSLETTTHQLLDEVLLSKDQQCPRRGRRRVLMKKKERRNQRTIHAFHVCDDFTDNYPFMTVSLKSCKALQNLSSAQNRAIWIGWHFPPKLRDNLSYTDIYRNIF